MVGYAATPLPRKLGIDTDSSVAVVGAPANFPIRARGKAPFDVIVVFVTARGELEQKIADARARMAEAGGLWVAWPKKSSGVATDMTEHAIREVALPTGLVDNKVCAIDDTWSGLRLVIRIAERHRREGRRELRGGPKRTPRRASARSAGR